MFNNKKGAKYGLLEWGVIIGIAVLIFQNVAPEQFASATGQETPADTTQIIIAGACEDPTSSYTIGPQSARWSPTTSMSAEEVYVWEIPYNRATESYSQDKYDVNVKVGSNSDSTKATATFRNKYAFLYGYASTVYWQSFVKDLEAPCGGFQSASIDSGKAALIANGTVTLYVYNDDNLRNSGDGVNNMTLGTSDTKTFNTIRMETADKSGFAPSGEYLVIVEVNKTIYDEENFQLGGKTTPLTAPGYYVPDQTDSATKAWKFSGCPTGDATRCIANLGGLYVDVASGENPTGSISASSHNVDLGDIKICFKPADYYLDTYTYEPKYGFEKNDGTDVSVLHSGNGACFWAAVA